MSDERDLLRQLLFPRAAPPARALAVGRAAGPAGEVLG